MGSTLQGKNLLHLFVKRNTPGAYYRVNTVFRKSSVYGNLQVFIKGGSGGCSWFPSETYPARPAI